MTVTTKLDKLSLDRADKNNDDKRCDQAGNLKEPLSRSWRRKKYYVKKLILIHVHVLQI